MFNFNAYAVNTFQTAFLQRFHGLDIADAANISAYSLGLAGVLGLLLGGWLGDRLRLPSRRLMLAALGFLIAAPCVFFALQQPKGGVAAFALLMATSTALTFMYYSTVYSALQDVVPPTLRGTTVSLYFFGQYVLGAAFGTTIMGALSDYFAHKAMIEAGAAAIEPFRAQGLHSAMYVIPVLSLLCAASLFGAAKTVTADAQRMRELPAGAAAEPA
jgi:MFS family permease